MYFWLSPDEVAAAARFPASGDPERAVADQADEIARPLRDGVLPDGYLPYLVRCLRRIREPYAAAEEAGEGVAVPHHAA